MIDPIHNQAYQEYTKVNRQKLSHPTDEKFTMDSSLTGNPSDKHASDGVIYEPGQNQSKDPETPAPSGIHRNTANMGRSQADPQQNDTRADSVKHEAAVKNTPPMTEIFRRLFQNMLQSIKKVLSAIWGSNPEKTQDTSADGRQTDSIDIEQPDADEAALLSAAKQQYADEAALLSAADTDPDALDRNIKTALKSGDTAAFRALLSDDGRKIPARNSSLLTYYDSKGRLIRLDPSDQHRILHGDRGSRKS